MADPPAMAAMPVVVFGDVTPGHGFVFASRTGPYPLPDGQTPARDPARAATVADLIRQHRLLRHSALAPLSPAQAAALAGATIAITPEPAAPGAITPAPAAPGAILWPAAGDATASGTDPWTVFAAAGCVLTRCPRVALDATLAGAPSVILDGRPYAPSDEGLLGDVERLLIDGVVWCNPYEGGTPSDPVTALLQLATLARHHRWTRTPTVCVGMRRWKRPAIAAMLAGATAPRFIADPERAVATAAATGARIVTWSTRMPRRLPALARAAGVPLWRMEDGFLRSAGLGSDFIAPLSVCLDDQGIYYDARTPSRLETLLASPATEEPLLLERARALMALIVRRHLTKYNAPAVSPLPDLPRDDRRLILVPGQVEDDQSILTAAPLVATNLGLLQAVRAAAPGAFVVYRPHPDVVAGNRRGAVAAADAAALADRVVTETATARLLPLVDEVHTMTSLVGFEALLRGKSVTVYGLPFYAGWGLTDDHLATARRQKTLSLEALVAGALILYPLYFDPVTARVATVETVAKRLLEGYPDPSRESVKRRILVRSHRLYQAIVRRFG